MTHSFVSIKKGKLDYLIFYITEEYVEDQVRFKEQIEPLLQSFGRDILDKGAIVKPFEKYIEDVNREVAEKFDQEFTRDVILNINDKMERPGLLILNADLEDFNPRYHNYLFVSLREYVSNFGQVNIFELKKFFDLITHAIINDYDIFNEVSSYLNRNKIVSSHKILELKPGIFGISINIKEFIKYLKN